MIRFCFIVLTILFIPLYANDRKIQTLYAGLDTGSLAQLTAFYQLYPETVEGKRALSHIEDLLLIACPLTNPKKEIDIIHNTLLDLSPTEALSYEERVNLMAIQIAARLPRQASAQEKITAINHFLFNEKQFRFPARRQWIEAIDIYTFLPSVLDSQRGVCLGVSILYLGIAQRLGLELEAVTPPGHIYLRYKEGNRTINIETTARGIHLPDEEYLGIEPPPLKTRSLKEVIGLSHINQASVFLRRKEYKEALSCYQKAANYLPNDVQLMEFQGCTRILLGDHAEGKQLFEKIKSRLAEDYLSGKVDRNGLEMIIVPSKEKREALRTYLKEFPLFRDGWITLAFICLELHRPQEALEVFGAYHAIDSTNPTVEYYLTALNIHLWNYPKAWEHLEVLEQLTLDYQPRVLKQMRAFLTQKTQGR